MLLRLFLLLFLSLLPLSVFFLWLSLEVVGAIVVVVLPVIVVVVVAAVVVVRCCCNYCSFCFSSCKYSCSTRRCLCCSRFDCCRSSIIICNCWRLTERRHWRTNDHTAWRRMSHEPKRHHEHGLYVERGAAACTGPAATRPLQTPWALALCLSGFGLFLSFFSKKNFPLQLSLSLVIYLIPNEYMLKKLVSINIFLQEE